MFLRDVQSQRESTVTHTNDGHMRWAMKTVRKPEREGLAEKAWFRDSKRTLSTGVAM